MTKNQLRKFLIKHLDDAIVPYEKWRNRDTPAAQEGQARMRMLLKAWCDFKLMSDYRVEVKQDEVDKFLETDEQWTMYISIFYYSFEDNWEWHTSYTPTPKRLAEVKAQNRDWY